MQHGRGQTVRRLFCSYISDVNVSDQAVHLFNGVLIWSYELSDVYLLRKNHN